MRYSYVARLNDERKSEPTMSKLRVVRESHGYAFYHSESNTEENIERVSRIITQGKIYELLRISTRQNKINF